MRLWIAEGIQQKEIESFLNMNVNKIGKFSQINRKIIEKCGAYTKKDSYALCFCADWQEEVSLFVVPLKGKINNKETFEELISTSRIPPIEFSWEEINRVEEIV